jgi:arginine utilization protein RocB
MRNDIAARAREIALEITSWPSVTGSNDEARFALRFGDYIEELGQTWIEPMLGDAAGRSNVFLLKRGRSNKTVVLTGHFDVVSIDDFATLKNLAFDAEKLLPEIIARLKSSRENDLALLDFESGEFLPGRGLLDMKAGLAAGLVALEHYQGDATLLFIAVSDEEDRSAGARAVAPRLKMISEEYGLNIQLIINLDAISDQSDGAKARVATMGSIGKQLLTAYVVGRQSHAGYPQDGANATYLAAELISEFELSPELSETTGDEVAAPPTCLHAKDVKEGYNVTTPAASWVYWNTMQHRRSADEVFGISIELATRAMKRAALRVKREVPVMTYAELAKMVPPAAIAAKAEEIARLTSLDFAARSKLLTEFVWGQSGLVGPCVVLGFGSIPYPAVSLSNAALESNISSTLEQFGIGTLKYFAGISDMSFFGEASGDLAIVAANTPIWGTSFTMRQAAGYPCINLGPWGRDYHTWLERLHAPYAFEVLPLALLAVIDAVV